MLFKDHYNSILIVELVFKKLKTSRHNSTFFASSPNRHLFLHACVLPPTPTDGVARIYFALTPVPQLGIEPRQLSCTTFAGRSFTDWATASTAKQKQLLFLIFNHFCRRSSMRQNCNKGGKQRHFHFIVGAIKTLWSKILWVWSQALTSHHLIFFLFLTTLEHLSE